MAFNASIIITGIADTAQRAAQNLGNAFTAAGVSAKELVRNLNRLSNVNNQVRASVVDAQRSLIDFRNALGGAASGVIINQMYKMTNLFIGWENQLLAATGSAEAAQDALDDMIASVERLGTNLTTSANGFVQLQIAARGSSVSVDDVTNIFESFSGALTLFNADTLKTEGTFRALTQMFSKGVVQAEELRGQLAEHLPGAFQMAARAMGVGTAALGRMMKEGKLLAEDLIPRLADQIQKELGVAIEQALKTPRAAYNRLITEFDKLFATLGKLISTEFIDLMNLLTKSLKELTAFIVENATQIKFITGLFAGFLAVVISVNTTILALSTTFKLLGSVLSVIATTNPILKAIQVTIGLLTVGVGSLAGGLYFAKESVVAFNAETDTASDVWWRFLETLTGFESVETEVSNSVANLSQELDELGTQVHQISLGDFAEGYIRVFKEEFAKIKSQSKPIIDDFFKSLKQAYTSSVSYLKGIGESETFKSLVDAIGVGFKSIKFMINLMIASYLEFAKVVGNVWDSISNATKKATADITSNDIINFFTGMLKYVKWVANTIVNLIIWMAETVADTWRKISDNTSGFLDAVYESVTSFSTEPIRKFWSESREIAVAELDLTRDRLGEAYELLASDAIYELSGIPDYIGDLTDETVEELEKMLSKLESINARAMTAAQNKAWVKVQDALYNELAAELSLQQLNTIKTVSAAADALDTLTGKTGDSTEELQDKLRDLTHELELLQTNGLEETSRKMKQFAADMKYSQTVIQGAKILNDAKTGDTGAQESFQQLVIAAEEERKLAYQVIEAETKLDEKRDSLKETTKELTKSTKDYTTTIYELKSAYLDLIMSLDSADQLLRDMVPDYDALIDKADSYMGKIKEFNDIQIQQYVAPELMNPNSPESLNLFNEMMDSFKQMDPSELPFEIVTNGILDVNKAWDFYLETNELVQNSADPLQAVLQSMSNKLDEYSSSVIQTSNVLGSTNFKKAADDLSLVKQYSSELSVSYDELAKAIADVKDFEKLRSSQSSLTLSQMEAEGQALEYLGRATDAYLAKRERLYNEEVRLIQLGKQDKFVEFKFNDNELKDMADNFESAKAKAMDFNLELVKIQELVDTGWLTPLEASLARTEAAFKKLDPLAQEIGNAFSDAFYDLISGSASAEEAVSNMLKGIAEAVYQQLVAKQIANIIGSIVGGITGGFGGGGGSYDPWVGTTKYSDAGFFAKGGIMTEDGPMQLKRYASGGIANSPQLALFGEGAKPEAYVPLPDGRSIPVTMTSDSKTSNQNQKPEVKVIVNNLPGQNAEVTRDQSGELTIEIVRSALANDMNRGGVPWVGAMERRYGMSRGRGL